jgi:two-component system, response regulator PdtaR
MTAATEFSRPRVLVVEDEGLIREMLLEALTDDGFDVGVAASGEEAIGYLVQACSCDVLFTDINLGRGMDGVALSWAARQLRPRLPVVYASGAVASLWQLQGVPGASFLRKPYNPFAAGAVLRAAALGSTSNLMRA